MQVCPFQLDDSDLVLKRQVSPVSHGKPKVLAICREQTTVSRSQCTLASRPSFRYGIRSCLGFNLLIQIIKLQLPGVSILRATWRRGLSHSSGEEI